MGPLSKNVLFRNTGAYLRRSLTYPPSTRQPSIFTRIFGSYSEQAYPLQLDRKVSTNNNHNWLTPVALGVAVSFLYYKNHETCAAESVEGSQHSCEMTRDGTKSPFIKQLSTSNKEEQIQLFDTIYRDAERLNPHYLDGWHFALIEEFPELAIHYLEWLMENGKGMREASPYGWLLIRFFDALNKSDYFINPKSASAKFVKEHLIKSVVYKKIRTEMDFEGLLKPHCRMVCLNYYEGFVPFLQPMFLTEESIQTYKEEIIFKENGEVSVPGFAMTINILGLLNDYHNNSFCDENGKLEIQSRSINHVLSEDILEKVDHDLLRVAVAKSYQLANMLAKVVQLHDNVPFIENTGALFLKNVGCPVKAVDTWYFSVYPTEEAFLRLFKTLDDNETRKLAKAIFGTPDFKEYGQNLMIKSLYKYDFNTLGSFYEAAPTDIRREFIAHQLKWRIPACIRSSSKVLQAEAVKYFLKDRDLKKLRSYLDAYDLDLSKRLFPFSMEEIDNQSLVTFYDDLIEGMSEEQFKKFVHFIIEQQTSVCFGDIAGDEMGDYYLYEPGMLAFMLCTGAGMARIQRSIYSGKIYGKNIEAITQKVRDNYISGRDMPIKYIPALEKGIQTYLINQHNQTCNIL
ncbi:MAG: hypothetical protein H7A37_10815 [Chlamydiales bacterium]|nr:hypothetical protein [Chlamydiales bacterium]